MGGEGQLASRSAGQDGVHEIALIVAVAVNAECMAEFMGSSGLEVIPRDPRRRQQDVRRLQSQGEKSDRRVTTRAALIGNARAGQEGHYDFGLGGVGALLRREVSRRKINMQWEMLPVQQAPDLRRIRTGGVARKMC